jgi:hypothetical protein
MTGAVWGDHGYASAEGLAAQKPLFFLCPFEQRREDRGLSGAEELIAIGRALALCNSLPQEREEGEE